MGFTWVPFFKEMSEKLLPYQNNSGKLIEFLKKCDVSIGNTADELHLDMIDPFTFLSLIIKHGHQKRSEILQALRPLLNITSPLPSDFNGIPTLDARNAWLGDLKNTDLKQNILRLWSLYSKMLKNEPVEADFNAILKIKGVGKQMLTIAMFWVKPDTYLSLDANTMPYLKKRGIESSYSDFSSYAEIIKAAREKLPNIPFYQISYDAWRENQQPRYWCFKIYPEYFDHAVEIKTCIMGYDYNKDDKASVTRHWKAMKEVKPGDFLVIKVAEGGTLFYGTATVAEPRKPGDHTDSISRTVDEKIHKFDNGIVRLVDSQAFYQDFTDNFFKDNPDSMAERVDVDDLLIVDGKCVSLKGISKEIKKGSVQDSLFEITENFYNKVRDSLMKKENLVDFDSEDIPQDNDDETAADNCTVEDDIEILEDDLNVILYGPPGTGKTYNTVNKALNIINGKGYANEKKKGRKILKAEFDDLAAKGIIQFITFHQSYSYEDFIEGIRPDCADEDKIKYCYKDGIFKRIAIEALYDLMSLSMSKLEQSFDVALRKMQEELPAGSEIGTITGNQFTIIDYLENSIHIMPSTKINTFPISLSPLRKLYQCDKTNPLKKATDVWKTLGRYGGLSSYYFAITKKLSSYDVKESEFTGSGPEYEEKKDKVLELLNSSAEIKNNSARPYVLIIDEINRGNIAKIFGELITLIEPDKRYGSKNCLTVTLPYSGENFCVPSNLYIIGTMNTADRSIEALDTALRRRFIFEKFSPKLNVLERNPNVQNMKSQLGIDLVKLLKMINERIAVLYDKDHRIGHSFFLNMVSLNDLVSTFENKIMPLLQEYFYSDLGKIRLILGDAFVKISENQVSFKCEQDDDRIDELKEKKRFYFTRNKDWTTEDFISIYE
ncbi:MAG: AAA family ATPase [Candidatus Wallbacteria bacterium]|nr:AAA family ATPase [Candidatus Wallbacteria bacterium]